MLDSLAILITPYGHPHQALGLPGGDDTDIPTLSILSP
jgi:hypothetical protein